MHYSIIVFKWLKLVLQRQNAFSLTNREGKKLRLLKIEGWGLRHSHCMIGTNDGKKLQVNERF